MSDAPPPCVSCSHPRHDGTECGACVIVRPVGGGEESVARCDCGHRGVVGLGIDRGAWEVVR